MVTGLHCSKCGKIIVVNDGWVKRQPVDAVNKFLCRKCAGLPRLNYTQLLVSTKNVKREVAL